MDAMLLSTLDLISTAYESLKLPSSIMESENVTYQQMRILWGTSATQEPSLSSRWTFSLGFEHLCRPVYELSAAPMSDKQDYYWTLTDCCTGRPTHPTDSRSYFIAPLISPSCLYFISSLTLPFSRLFSSHRLYLFCYNGEGQQVFTSFVGVRPFPLTFYLFICLFIFGQSFKLPLRHMFWECTKADTATFRGRPQAFAPGQHISANMAAWSRKGVEDALIIDMIVYQKLCALSQESGSRKYIVIICLWTMRVTYYHMYILTM